MSSLQGTSSPLGGAQQATLDPTIPEDSVVVRILIGATSASNNTHIGDFNTTPNSAVVEGRGTAGEVIDVGRSVTTLQRTDRVAIELTPPNRRCNSCEDKCPRCTAKVFTNQNQTYCILQSNLCTRLGELTIYEGALVEPVAIAFNLFNKGNIANLASNSAIIFGANFVGVFCYIIAKSYKKEVMVVDTDGSRLALAEKYEARTFNIPPLETREGYAKDIANMIENCFNKGGVDVAINASGDDVFFLPAISVLKRGGLYLQAGVKPTEFSFDVYGTFEESREDEIKVEGHIGYTASDFARAVEFMRNGRVDMADFCRS